MNNLHEKAELLKSVLSIIESINDIKSKVRYLNSIFGQDIKKDESPLP